MIFVNLIKIDYDNFSIENNVVALTGILSSSIAAILISILIISKKINKKYKEKN